MLVLVQDALCQFDWSPVMIHGRGRDLPMECTCQHDYAISVPAKTWYRLLPSWSVSGYMTIYHEKVENKAQTLGFQDNGLPPNCILPSVTPSDCRRSGEHIAPSLNTIDEQAVLKNTLLATWYSFNLDRSEFAISIRNIFDANFILALLLSV